MHLPPRPVSAPTGQHKAAGAIQGLQPATGTGGGHSSGCTNTAAAKPMVLTDARTLRERALRVGKEVAVPFKVVTALAQRNSGSNAPVAVLPQQLRVRLQVERGHVVRGEYAVQLVRQQGSKLFHIRDQHISNVFAGLLVDGWKVPVQSAAAGGSTQNVAPTLVMQLVAPTVAEHTELVAAFDRHALQPVPVQASARPAGQREPCIAAKAASGRTILTQPRAKLDGAARQSSRQAAVPAAAAAAAASGQPHASDRDLPAAGKRRAPEPGRATAGSHGPPVKQPRLAVAPENQRTCQKPQPPATRTGAAHHARVAAPAPAEPAAREAGKQAIHSTNAAHAAGARDGHVPAAAPRAEAAGPSKVRALHVSPNQMLIAAKLVRACLAQPFIMPLSVFDCQLATTFCLQY